MPRIYDNIEFQLTEGLNNALEVAYKADFCVGYFNLRGWKEVANNIEKFEGGEGQACRLLVGMQRLPKDILKSYFSNTLEDSIDRQTALQIKRKLAQEFKEQLTIGIPTETDEKGLRKLAQQIKSQKVRVKLFLRNSLHAKLYLAFRTDKINPIMGFVGSSNLTFAGLSNQGELNVDVLELDAGQKLAKWFDERWNDKWCLDISEELAEILDNSWASEKLFSPYFLYLKIAYHLSQEARAGLNEFKIPKVFQNKLLEFQQKAVLVSAHHLNKRGGVIIGDVVGLGKTITATALAKIFEDDFFLETLIICPKNLVSMWEDYAHDYQLRAKVISSTQAQSILPKLRRFRLVIIDESHNLRNREGKRYRAIREYIQINESKVILLSATPYNKTYLDLSSQLRLFINEEADLGISPERFIENIGGRIQFSARFQYPLRSLLAFEKSEFADDWRELMRLYLVRRTRSFVKEHYSKTDTSNNRKYLEFADGSKSYFPERIPKVAEYDFDTNDPNDQYARLYSENIVNIISELNLSRYGLNNYLLPTPSTRPDDKENTIISNLSRAGKRLIGFCRTNLFKRLESSGVAFLLSLARHILRNYVFIYALKNNLALPIGAQEANLLDDFLEDTDLDQYEDEANTLNLWLDENTYLQQAEKVYKTFQNTHSKKFDWIRSEFFDQSLPQDLNEDCQQILSIIQENYAWQADKDKQLNTLADLCNQQYPQEKILIFTQFTDTAKYLYEELKKQGVKQLEWVSGLTENPTEYAHRFSPHSNQKPEYTKKGQEIRILISTDVLSEGQNLQDAHIIVNYDLPWAIIRLIQRAGRVDRIGQKADKIFCYSFLPEEGIEEIINLRGRLRQRISQNAEVVGSDEVFFEGDPVNLYDLYSEKSGILDGEQEDEVDLASQAYQIWKNAIDKQPELQKTIPNLPNVIYATKAVDNPDFAERVRNSVIVYTRTVDDNDVLTLVGKSGEILTQSQATILRVAECEANVEAQARMANHHELVQIGVKHIQDTEVEVGGQLGKKTGARFQTYNRLQRYYEEYKDTLFVTEGLIKAIDDIYKYPLREFARDTINRQMKAGMNDTQLVELVISLREENKLCIVEDDEETKVKLPQIICSMGLI
jgi:superfamily II DNA or RNA helicase